MSLKLMAHPKPKQPSVIVHCAYCGRLRKKAPSKIRLMKGENHFCSVQCIGKFRRKLPPMMCDQCGKSFSRCPAEQRKSPHKNNFCSRVCQLQWRDEHRSDHSYKKVDGRHEHRTVAEQVLGRNLAGREVVHHVDADKDNNNPRNLIVFPSQSEHYRWHHEMRWNGRIVSKDLLKFRTLA
jgi:hypothetical protein